MKTFTFTTILVSLVASVKAAAMVNTPTGLVTCEPSALTWTGGTAPYYLTVIPGGQPSAAALVSFPAVSAMSYTWTVNLPANTVISLALKDSTGAIVYSDKATIQAGSNTSCVGSSSAASAGTTGAAAVGSTAATTSQAGANTATAGTAASANAAGASTTTGSSAAASSSSPKSGAGKVVAGAALGAVGLLAAVAL